jgi:hypothetical protein
LLFFSFLSFCNNNVGGGVIVHCCVLNRHASWAHQSTRHDIDTPVSPNSVRLTSAAGPGAPLRHLQNARHGPD